MSSENVSSETYEGSLEDEQYRVIEQEEQLWGGEHLEQLQGEDLDKHWSTADISSYETITNEEIDYSKEEKQIKVTGQINLIEELRLKQSELTRRKTRALHTLTELIEKGLCEKDIQIRDGTKEEVKQYYEKLLLEFKNKKEAAVKRLHDLKEEKNLKSEYLESKRNEYTELAENQYNLELKTAMGMINDKTKEKYTHDDVVKLLEPCKLQDIKINKVRLDYIVQKNKNKKIKNDIDKLIPSTLKNMLENQELTKKNQHLENYIGKLNGIKIKNQKNIKSELAKIPNIDKKLVSLKEKKEKKESELKKIKDEWKQHVEAKSLDQKNANRLKKRHKPDYFTENPLLMKDYYESIEKDKINKGLVNDLRQELLCIEELKDKLKSVLNIAEEQ